LKSRLYKPFLNLLVLKMHLEARAPIRKVSQHVGNLMNHIQSGIGTGYPLVVPGLVVGFP
jgi:hypothetical protein